MDDQEQDANSSLIRILQASTALDFASYQSINCDCMSDLVGSEPNPYTLDYSTENTRRFTRQIEYVTQSGILNDKQKPSTCYNHGTKLYNYIVFNLALSVPLSIILVILSNNSGSVHEKFSLILVNTVFYDAVWKHDLSSILLDICLLLCYVLWIDYCVNGLILFRHISLLIQILAEKLTGYNGGATLFHVQEAQNLLLSRFSWSKWCEDALRRTSIMDVYKFHSIIWLLPLFIVFILRNHLSPVFIPRGVQTIIIIFLNVLLVASMLHGIYLQMKIFHNQYKKFIKKPMYQRGAIERIIFRLISPLNQKFMDVKKYFNIFSSKDENPNLMSSSREEEKHEHFTSFITNVKTSIFSTIGVQLFIFVLYIFLGAGLMCLALRIDQIAFLEVDPWLLFSPIFIFIGMVMLYNLVTHLRLSYSYLYQNQRLYVKSACIMVLFFVFLLIQSVIIAYNSVGYALKVQEIWFVDWMSIFLPLCIFEIAFSVVGVTVLIAAGLRILYWMWGEARFVSKRSESEDVELSLELL